MIKNFLDPPLSIADIEREKYNRSQFFPLEQTWTIISSEPLSQNSMANSNARSMS